MHDEVHVIRHEREGEEPQPTLSHHDAQAVDQVRAIMVVAEDVALADAAKCYVVDDAGGVATGHAGHAKRLRDRGG